MDYIINTQICVVFDQKLSKQVGSHYFGGWEAAEGGALLGQSSPAGWKQCLT